ncbi:protein disulfide isomerase, putative [Plasmodium gallinaceum]|uniref:Protein disulfide isomerase, putative n=1 Tax=Plasmodium gallinaceum TaxID=5849 RepID=A0A1J1GR32_PLAGA|nr:protein disulfide isomerase, putative [Plasmodium gallinaceum]CRG94924.1 protein disulfide isomerase, putative [Plasmodium gallinaceum]
MNYCKLLIILYLFIQIYSTENDNEENNEIYNLDMDNFDEIINDEENFTFLVVYTHWCHWSNLLLEDLEKISKLLKYVNNIRIAKINAAVNTSIIEKLNIYGYPSLFLIKRNNINRYNDMRNVRGIVLWIYEHLDESVFEIDSKEKLNAFLELDEYNNSILFFVSRNKKEDKIMIELVKLCILIGYTFCFYMKQENIIDYFENTIMLEKYHFDNKKSQNKDIYTVLFKNNDFDEYFYFLDEELNILYDSDYSKEEKIEELKKCISEKIEPLVIKFSEYYYSLLFSQNKVTLFILYNDINQLNKLDIIKSAKKYKNIMFSISGNKEVFEKRLLTELLIDDLKKPVMRIIEFKRSILIPYKYKPINDDIEINEKNIEEFIEGYIKDKKYFYRKSERPLPDEFNNGYVKIIVADTYDDYIFKNDKNVLVLYYAPWCGHCYKFEPIYREVGRRLKLYSSKFKDYEDDIIISKIDAVNNEIYNIAIDAYPTIYLYVKSNKNKPIKYLGARSVQSIVTWICEITNTNLDIQKLLSLNLDEEQLFENYEEL